MRLDSRLKAALATASLAGLLIALTAGGTATSAGAAPLPNCTVAQNIEGIIDDSGSMAGNDSDNYRADLLEALAFFNQDKTMGAALFGSDAAPLFGPVPVGPNFIAIKNALATVNSNGGGTDYDAGFTVANAQNPGANARIFLSDGEPNSTPDSNLWKSPKIPAYVVGFGSADFTILNQIATETGGPAPYAIENASQLRTVSQIINAAINCETPPILSERRFKSVGQTKTFAFRADGNTAQVLLSWPTVGNSFKPSFGGGGAKKGSVAVVAKKKKKGKVKVKSTRGETYIALDLSRIKGKVKFRLRAKRLSGAETVTAAIIP